MEQQIDNKWIDVGLRILKYLNKFGHSLYVLLGQQRGYSLSVVFVSHSLLGMIFWSAVRVRQRGLAPSDRPTVYEDSPAIAKVAVMVGGGPRAEKCLQMRRVKGGREQLNLREVRNTEHANLAVTPGLCRYPLNHVVDI